MLGTALIAVLLWSFGSGFLISPIPMQMVIVPTVLLLVASWVVADGDLVALPILALVANYLWLGHLVEVLIVPAVVLSGLAGAFVAVRRSSGRRSADPARWRRDRRHMAVAAGITVAMWIPPLIQQLTSRPGNLRLLVESAGSERDTLGSWGTAVHYTTDLVSRPWFWFRGTVEDPPYLHLREGPFLTPGLSLRDLVAALVIVAVLVTLGLAARRRGDRTGGWLVIVAGVALVAGVVTVHSAPTELGPVRKYAWSSWVIAMFVWLAIGVNLVRLGGHRLRRFTLAPLAGAVVVFTALNLPTAPYGYGTDGRRDTVIDEMNTRVVAALTGTGTVRMQIHGIQDRMFGDALVLAMRDADIGTCFPAVSRRGDGSRPACPDDVATTVTVRVTDSPEDPTADVLFSRALLDQAEQDELAGLRAEVTDWLASTDRVRLSPAAAERLGHPGAPDVADLLGDLSGDDGPAPSRLIDDEGFVVLVRLWYGAAKPTTEPLFAEGGPDAARWRRWITLADMDQTVMVTRHRTAAG